LANLQKLEANLAAKRFFAKSTKLVFKRLGDLIDTFGTTTIRIFPDSPEKNPEGIVVKGTHFIPLLTRKKNELTGLVEENEAKSAERCLQTYDKACPICETAEELSNQDDEEMQNAAQTIWVNWSWQMNVLVRELPEGEQYVILDVNTSGAQKKIGDLLKADENARDLVKGRDLTFSRNPGNRHIEMDISDRCPFTSNNKEWPEMLNNQCNLSKLGVKKVKTPAQLSNIVKVSMATIFGIDIS
jgi:hypothetical protein